MHMASSGLARAALSPVLPRAAIRSSARLGGVEGGDKTRGDC